MKKIYLLYKPMKKDIQNLSFYAWTTKKELAKKFMEIRDDLILVKKEYDENDDIYGSHVLERTEIISYDLKTKNNETKEEVIVPVLTTLSEIEYLRYTPDELIFRNLQEYINIPASIFKKEIQNLLNNLEYTKTDMFVESLPFDNCYDDCSQKFKYKIDELALFLNHIK